MINFLGKNTTKQRKLKIFTEEDGGEDGATGEMLLDFGENQFWANKL